MRFVNVLRRAAPTSLLCAAILPASQALAQTAPPPPLTPGALPPREQLAPPVPLTTPSAAQVSVNGDHAIQAPPCALASSPVRVTINAIHFTTLDGGEIAPEFVRALGGIGPAVSGEQPIAAVCDIRDRANEALRQAGYIASVQIPPQQITDGTLRLAVVSARITEIRVTGETGRYRDEIQRRLDQVRGLQPFNQHEAERILLLAQDIPGLRLQLTLRPAGTAPGDVIGEANVQVSSFSVVGNVQNYGSRAIGRETGFARAEFYGLTGLADMTFIGASTVLDFKEQEVLMAGHQMGIGSSGTRLEGTFTYAWTKPSLGALDLKTRSAIGGLDISTPLMRARTTNLFATGGIDFIQQKTKVFGSTPLNLDRLRVLYARLSGNWRKLSYDGTVTASLRGALEIRQGLDILNATKRRTVTADGYSPSRFDGDAAATVVKGSLTGYVGLGPIFSIASTVQGQWANHALLNFEEYSIGNLTIGRGYDPGSNTADRAIGLSNEVRAAPISNEKFRLELFAFTDSVWIWNLDTGTTENDRLLRSWGGGARFSLPGRAQLEVTYARPQDKALSVNAHKPTDRVLASLTFQFGPR